MAEDEIVDGLFNALLKLAKEKIDENVLKEKAREIVISVLKKYVEVHQLEGR